MRWLNGALLLIRNRMVVSRAVRFWGATGLVFAVTLSACGTSSNSGLFTPGGPDASTDGSPGITTDGSLLPTNGDDSGKPPSNCVPKTCAELGAGCGPQGDGCGNPLDCGTCTGAQTCGGGGIPSQCGGSAGCVPATTCPAGITCGPASDGCGGAIASCGTCTAPQSCGGAGKASQCGAPACVPLTACPAGQTCGVAPDGCGATISCDTCTAPATCGGGGVHFVCGVGGSPSGSDGGAGTDAGTSCVPLTACPAGQNCGMASDGCGGTIASCGTCTAPQICGGGGTPSQCGDTTKCVPATACPAGQSCGVAPDGCGGSIACGTCTAPATCGGGGTANACGQAICTAKTCAELGFTCGVNGNGCGGTVSCGTCAAPEFCGGGGTSVCGPASLAACDSGTTTLSGFVYDPANNLPVYNALVYVPTGTVQAPATGINAAAPVCGCTAPSAYASAFTGIDGSFKLTNVPSGSAVTVVVQLGKWQRTFTEPVTACVANTIAAHLTLPSTHLQGNIPRFAIDTGAVDTMECVLLKMGIAQSEFVDPAIAGGVPTAAQRVHLYQGSIVNGGAVVDATTPTEDALTESATVMDSYDVILFPCQGAAGTYDANNGFPNTLANLVTYADDGGRVFTTHFHYDLLDGNGTFSGTANWEPGTGSWGNYYGDTKYNSNIDQTFARGLTLASWLNQPIVYGGTLGQIPVGVVRNDFSSVIAPAQRWMYTANDSNVGGTGQGPGPNLPIHYTFDTPFNAAATCGRVVYSDFHVESQQSATTSNGVLFPGECPAGAMTPQEKLLEFMLFDLTSCVSTPTCTPKTCAQQGIQCGPAGDGCGNVIAGGCGVCTSPASCGGGGVAGVCGGGCTPTGCPAGQNCGIASNGCGGSVACGTCTAPATCGGGGVANVCGAPTCTPSGCPATQKCGVAPDGCGGLTTSCGTCAAPEFCGGGGPGLCGVGDAGASCVPLTCAEQGVACGPAGDGCGGTIASCGTCPGQTCPAPTETCGGGGTPSVCGSACKPQTCAELGVKCGSAPDGCGCVLDCGPCTLPQTCGGGGTAGVCGSPSCTPTTCLALGFTCGPAGDGCGGALDCGTCTAPDTCGGGGVSNVCGGSTSPK